MSYVFPGVALYGASAVNLLRYGTGGATRGSLAVGYWPTCDCMQYSGYMVGAVQLLRIYLPHNTWHGAMFGALHPSASDLVGSWLMDETSGVIAAEEFNRAGMSMTIDNKGWGCTSVCTSVCTRVCLSLI